MPPTPARCYLRVSTEEQALSGYSLAAQREHLQACLDRLGWTCAGWYIDEGKSAKDLNRPAFGRLLAEAQAGDLVLVTKLDRLTRSVRDLDDLLKEFARRGLSFQSATEQFETRTPGGRLYMAIVAVIAQWEREIIADRSAMGKRQKVMQGEWAGGPIPFGYRAAPSGRLKRGRELLQLEPDAITGPVVHEIFERYVRGQGMRAICQWLNDEARMPTANGARWRVSSLARLLTNPLYAGYVTHGRRKGSDVIQVKGSHQAIISEELFGSTQRMFSSRKSMAPRQATGMYPLAGIARCGVCGGAIDSALSRRRGSYAYRCRNYVNGVGCRDHTGRSNASLAGPIAEGSLVAALDRIPRPQDLGRFALACSTQVPDPKLLTHARTLARAEMAIHRWEGAFEASQITFDELTERTAEHRATIQAIRAQIRGQKQAPVPPSPERLASSSFSLSRAWEHLAPPERKALLQELIRAFQVQILLHPDRKVSLVPTAEPPAPGGAPHRPAGRRHGPTPATAHTAD